MNLYTKKRGPRGGEKGGLCDTPYRIPTLAVLRNRPTRANRLDARTPTHTRACKEVDSLALTLRSTISYIEAADWTTTTTTVADITITERRHPRNTWRRVYAENRGAARRWRGGARTGDGFLNLAIKDPSWPG